MRALAPQRHIVSFRQGTVEPQPPPHARSVVAWPIVRQGFYGGQPVSHPGLDPSRGRSHSPHPSVTGSYDDRLTDNDSFLRHNGWRGPNYRKATDEFTVATLCTMVLLTLFLDGSLTSDRGFDKGLFFREPRPQHFA